MGRQKVRAEVTFVAEDVQSIWEIRREVDSSLPELTLDQADAWLDRNRKYIENDMTERGNASIDTLLDEDDPTTADS